MNHWNVLTLEPTADKTLIKSAYAQKLKHTRPDVDPEGFKLLHASYKQALAESRHIVSDSGLKERPIVRDVEIVPQIQNEPDTENSTEPKVTNDKAERLPEDIQQQVIYESISPLGPEQSNNIARIYHDLKNQSARILENLDKAREVESWQFLEANTALYDIELRSQFSFYLFGQLLAQPEDIKVRRLVIEYLNSIFRWTENRTLLDTSFGYESVDLILKHLEAKQNPGVSRWFSPRVHVGPIEIGGYYTRIAATLIDWLAVSTSVYGYHKIKVIAGFSENVRGLDVFLLIVPIYLLMTVIMEASPFQGGPGKVLLGLKVTTKKGRRLNIFHTMFRALVFTTTTAAFKITIWINIFLNDGHLLHDHISFSSVAKR